MKLWVESTPAIPELKVGLETLPEKTVSPNTTH